MIRVNGESVEWHRGMTVSDVLRLLNYRFPLLIVRIDGRLVSRSDYGTTEVADGISMDAIHMISGG